ncbi:MAG TPA: SulP family inorganic anion transporter [Saprospiraceae bacterium]|nr:SulP family inorganic anion transporter [Saprospiraceae bacterium]HMQ81783.1 SulP family inorganic anion transporter [Saprospiraceae bacterium]
MEKQHKSLPQEGFAGLKENFSTDAISGFIIFLLALPLSLGIAKASEFPPIMGVVTAIIGGLVVSFFTGSKLTIKGPAAGLIVIVAGAVTEFGGGIEGWKMTLGVMVLAGLIQILFGILKLGKLVDFFPLSAVHGMLAAIGLILIAKQIPVLLNVNPQYMAHKGPLDLLASIPIFIEHLDPTITIIGIISLIILFAWKSIKVPFLARIPAPLVVLAIAIPFSMFFDLKSTAPAYTLVKVGSLLEQVGYHADFSGFSQTGVFFKYLVMVSLVGSLESLLTVKAIDMVDPYKRKSNANKDLIAIGIGNTISALLGGLPMISEVARSSANVSNGAKTQWANFFHGVFMLVFVLLAYPVLELIPNAALAAMLIAVGVRLAHPKEFIHTYRIGSEQLAIFVTTIFFTLIEDLLVGIAAGIVLKIIFHITRGVSFRSLFRSKAEVKDNGDQLFVHLGDAAVFTNYLSLKKQLETLPKGKEVNITLDQTKLIDHSVLENLHHFEEEYALTGGHIHLVGLENMNPLSKHPLAARKRKNGAN